MDRTGIVYILTWQTPGVRTNFLIPRGVSQMGDSRKTNCFLKGADRIQVKSGVGISDINQKDQPRTRY
jgi:hypothetical protein